jgi:hypothetical protein
VNAGRVTPLISATRPVLDIRRAQANSLSEATACKVVSLPPGAPGAPGSEE